MIILKVFVDIYDYFNISICRWLCIISKGSVCRCVKLSSLSI